MTDLLLTWLEPILTAGMLALIAALFSLARKAPKVLRGVVDELKRQAANTPGKADDAAAAALGALVDAFDKALSRELPDKRRKRP